MEHTENPVEETKDVCVVAIIGAVMGLTSPLALLSDKMLFLPVSALVVLLAGFLIMALHKKAMIGRHFAFFSLCLTLFCGTVGWVSADAYRKCEIDSARHFAGQWFELMTTGRQLEALQLEHPAVQRAKGVGVLKRYTTDPKYLDSYKAFMENDAVKFILREFQGADVQFIRLENTSFSRRLTSYFVVFELGKGEGAMRKTRQFKIQIAAAKEYSKQEGLPDRYEWTTRLIEII